MPIGTLRTSRPPWDRTIRFSVCMLFSTMMLALTACGQNSAPATSTNPLTDPRNLATPASADGRFSVDVPASLHGNDKPAGPFAEVKPLEIRQGGSLGSLGLNLDTYFAGNLNDTNARIDRLEGAVTAMHRDLKILAPSMQRLALIETDLQDLVGQLEAMLQENGVDAAPVPAYTPPIPISSPEPAEDVMEDAEESVATSSPAPVTAPAPAPAPSVPQAVEKPAPAAASAPPPPASTGSPQISAVRFGGDAGKTRIVFDATQAVTYTKDIDNGEKLLVVEIPNAAWGAAAQGTAPKSSAIDSWTAQSNGSGGTRIVMTLKKSVSVIYEGTMKPESSNPHHRIVIDLKPNE